MPRAPHWRPHAPTASTGRVGWGLLAVVAAVAVGGVLLMGAGGGSASPPTEAAAAAARVTSGPPPAAASAPGPTAEAPLLAPAQWAQLQASLAGQPGRDAELARILDLLAYQRDARRLAAMRQAGVPATDGTLRDLARRLDAGLALRLARGEISGPEAQHLKAALLEVLQPDPAQRPGELIAWRDAQWRGQAPARDPRDDQWLQAQRALVADWRTHQPAGGSPEALVQALQAQRLQIYETPP